MGGDKRFWFLFGGIWLLVGVGFIAASLGVNLFADPAMLNQDAPLWLFFLLGLVCTGLAGLASILPAVRNQRLMQSGVQITATVIDIRRSMIMVDPQRPEESLFLGAA